MHSLADMTKEELEKELLIQKVLKATDEVARNDARNAGLVGSLDNSKTAKIWRFSQLTQSTALIIAILVWLFCTFAALSRVM